MFFSVVIIFQVHNDYNILMFDIRAQFCYNIDVQLKVNNFKFPIKCSIFEHFTYIANK